MIFSLLHCLGKLASMSKSSVSHDNNNYSSAYQCQNSPLLFGLQGSITEFLTLLVFKFHFQGSGFVSFVQFGDKTVSSNVPCTSKKQAEQLAAREALLAIGVNDPENAFRNKGSRKNKSKRMVTPRTGFKRTWVHAHGGQGPQLDTW